MRLVNSLRCHTQKVTSAGGPSTSFRPARGYIRTYPVERRADIHTFVCAAVEASGGSVLHASSARSAPIILGVASHDERIALVIYCFRMTGRATRSRPDDEVRGQIRYGGAQGWSSDDHFVGRDPIHVDTTIMLGVEAEREVMIGVDPEIYDPLPMGISIYAKADQLDVAAADGWNVWERRNVAGTRRAAPRSAGGLETVVGFTSSRLLDYARFERNATELGLDASLRFAAARLAATTSAVRGDLAHVLEREFQLSSREILDLVKSRSRLSVAVRGGVAEHHLHRQLTRDRSVRHLVQLDRDGMPDFEVIMRDGRRVLVECKNASPKPYADGSPRVEVQKTRATQGDPAGRLYRRVGQFDVVAACLYATTGQWSFRFAPASSLDRADRYPDRIRPLQRVDARWHPTLAAALDTGETGL